MRLVLEDGHDSGVMAVERKWDPQAVKKNTSTRETQLARIINPTNFPVLTKRKVKEKRSNRKRKSPLCQGAKESLTENSRK